MEEGRVGDVPYSCACIANIDSYFDYKVYFVKFRGLKEVIRDLIPSLLLTLLLLQKFA